MRHVSLHDARQWCRRIVAERLQRWRQPRDFFAMRARTRAKARMQSDRALLRLQALLAALDETLSLTEVLEAAPLRAGWRAPAKPVDPDTARRAIEAERVMLMDGRAKWQRALATERQQQSEWNRRAVASEQTGRGDLAVQARLRAQQHQRASRENQHEVEQREVLLEACDAILAGLPESEG